MLRQKFNVTTLSALLSLLAWGGAAHGQELLDNRTFDQDISGWENLTGYGPVEWDGTHGQPPGSLRLTGNLPSAATECLPIVPGIITFRVDAFAQTSDHTGLCSISFYWYKSTDCTGSALIPAEHDEPIIPTTGPIFNEWTALEFVSGQPDGRRSFQGVFGKSSYQDACFLDNASLVQEPFHTVPTVDAMGLLILAVILGLAGVVVSRRRPG